MRVLVACEFSGIVRDAFRALGHDAWSCDLLPSESDYKGPHLEGDVLNWLSPETSPVGGWDLMIAHPPCQFLNHAGVRWLYKYGKRWIKDENGKVIGENPRDKDRWVKMWEAATFFKALLNAPIPRIAVENSEMHPYALRCVGRDSDCVVNPWEHGHGETKATHLWLKNLPPITPTNIVEGREPRVHHASPGKDRWKERSRTLKGVAQAFATQWGNL